MSSKLTAGIIVAVSVAIYGDLAKAQDQSSNEVLQGMDNAWLDGYRDEVNQQFEMISEAYSLDDAAKSALRQELDIRLQKQKAFEDKELPELNELIAKLDPESQDDTTPEAQAAWAKVDLITKTMPLAEEMVVEWVEKSQLSVNPGEGRLRWLELRERRDQVRFIKDEGEKEVGGFGSKLADGRSAFEAIPVPETGEPLPSGEKGTRLAPTAEKKRVEHSAVVPPNLTAANPDLAPKNAKQQAAAKQAQSAGPSGTDAANPAKPESPQTAKPTPEVPRTPEVKPNQPAEVVPAVAPPLDDWDKYVLTLANKYSFDDAQMTNAQSILRDLKRRANQYRMSRSDAIAKAQLMTEAKAREAELKVLNRPLDAMFEELKQRLEALPTADQRSKAGATPPAKAKDAKK